MGSPAPLHREQIQGDPNDHDDSSADQVDGRCAGIGTIGSLEPAPPPRRRGVPVEAARRSAQGCRGGCAPKLRHSTGRCPVRAPRGTGPRLIVRAGRCGRADRASTAATASGRPRRQVTGHADQVGRAAVTGARGQRCSGARGRRVGVPRCLGHRTPGFAARSLQVAQPRWRPGSGVRRRPEGRTTGTSGDGAGVGSGMPPRPAAAATEVVSELRDHRFGSRQTTRRCPRECCGGLAGPDRVLPGPSGPAAPRRASG